MKHADCELMDMLEKIAPPPELERVAIFKAAVMRFQESVGDPFNAHTEPDSDSNNELDILGKLG